MKFNLNSALQQAKQNMETFGGYSPSNIKKQVAAIPKWMETSLINTLDRWTEKLSKPADVKGYFEKKFAYDRTAPPLFRETTTVQTSPAPIKTSSPVPTAVEQARENFNDQSIIPNRISITDSKVEGKVRDYPYAQAEMAAFGDINEATRSAQVTHHPLQKEWSGKEGYGENAGFVTGKGSDDYNYELEKYIKPDKTLGWKYKLDKNGNKVHKYINNPFTGKQELSEDRGLKRLNNDTFYMALNSPVYRQQAFQLGVIDSPDQMTAQQAQKYWDDMYNPEKNIRMSRVIYNFHEDKKGANQGFSGWFAAPNRFIGVAPKQGVDY